MAKGYAFGHDPYRDLERLIPAKVSSKDSLTNLLNSLGSMQTSRIGLAALGQEEPKPKNKPGFVSTILDPEKGLLFAPARFVSAGVADIFGLAGDQVPELEQYNPLESAVRAAKGEFAVTGGDIFKTEDQDSILTRIGKLAGAFGYDVVTDPLNYFGGAGVFTRKGVLKLAADPEVSARLLSHIESRAASEGIDAAEAITKLASRSRRVALGDLTYDAGRKIIIDAAGEAVPETLVRDLAGDGLTNIIADAFTTRGRGAIIKDVAKEIGSEKIGREVFERLPQELVGGVFLKNPITGKPIQRIAGGKGYTNPFIEQANRARFALSAASGGRGLSRNFSGKMGTTWASYKYGLLSDNMDRLKEARTMFTDYVGYERALKKSGIEARNIANKAHAIISNVKQAAKNLTEEQVVEFDNGVKQFLANKNAVLTEATPVTQAAYDAAQELRLAYTELHGELKAAGVPVGELEDFMPLMYSDEYLQHLSKFDPRQGADLRGRYRGIVKRSAYGVQEPVAKDDLKSLGIKQAYVPAHEANRIANKVEGVEKIFEEDPIKQFTRYTEWAARTIASHRLVQSLVSSGTLMHLPEEVFRTVNVHNATAMVEAIKNLAPGAEEAARRNLATVRKQLEDMVSEETIMARQRKYASQLGVSTKAYNAAKRKESQLRTKLRAIDIAIAKNAPTMERLVAIAKDRGIGKMRVIEDVEVRLRHKAAERLRRLERQGVKLADNLDEADRILEMTLEQGGEVDVYNPLTKQMDTVTIEPASRSEKAAARAEAKAAKSAVKENSTEVIWETQYLRDIEEEITDTRAIIDELANTRATAEMDKLNIYLQSLEEKRTLTTEYLAAQEGRRAAKANLDTLRSDIMLPRGQGVKIAVDAFVDARRKFLAFRDSIGRGAIKNLPQEIQDQYRVLKSASDQAAETLYRTVGYVRPRKGVSQTAGREYAQMVVEMANTLSANEISVASVIADSAKLGDFMEAVVSQGSSHEVRMQAIGDLMKTYRSIRRYVSADDLDKLSNLQRAVYEGFYEGSPNVALKEVKKGRYTKRIEMLYDDLKAAQFRNADADEIAAIENKIAKLEKFTEEDGMRLIGANTQRVPYHLQDVYGPEGVRKAMERLYRVESNPTEWEKFVGDILDPLSLAWRTAATVGRGPGYLVNNLLGGLLNNFTGNVSVKSHAKSGKILHAFYKATKQVVEENPGVPRSALVERAMKYVESNLAGMTISGRPATEVFGEFLESGTWFTTDIQFLQEELRAAGLLVDDTVLSSRPGVNFKWDTAPKGVVDERFRNVISFLLLNPVQSKLNDASQATEMFLRLSAFIEGYERYGSRWAGEDLATMLHFDYQDLSDAERSLKRYVPFYTWTRNNVPLQLRALFLQQDKLRKIIIANENIKDAFGVSEDQSWLDQVLPDYIDIGGGFASNFTFGGNHLAFYARTPMQDVDQYLQTNYIFGIPVPMVRLTSVAGALGPGVAPLEFIAGRSFDTGQQFETLGERLNWGLRTFVPQYGTAQRLVSAATIPFTLAGKDLSGTPLLRSQEGMSNLFNFLAGSPYGMATLTEKQIGFGAMAQSQNLAGQLAQLAAEANVDLDWLRKEIRKGTSLSELKMKIATGQGNASLIRMNKQFEPATAPKRDYNQLLQSLGAGGYEAGY